MEDIAVDPPPATGSEVLVDRISDLPEPLLLTILSFLPTHRAVQTSLLSRRFRKLWTASPSLYFNRYAFSVTSRFVKMVDQVLSARDRTAPLERVLFKSEPYSRCLLPLKNVLCWFQKIDILGVRDLELSLEVETVVLLSSVIFSIKSLESLHISTLHLNRELALLPANIRCTRLKNLYAWVNMDSADLTRLVGGLPVLEDLELGGINQDTIDISSQSVKRLTLHCNASKMKLCFPNMDFMELFCKLGSLKQFHGKMPLVSEAKFTLDSPVEESMPVFSSMLRSVANVVRLRLSIEVRSGHPRSYLRCCDMQVSLPQLEYLNFYCYTGYLSMFQVEMPLLRKAEVRLSDVRQEFVPLISGLLKCIEKVVDLKLRIRDHWAQLKPFHILDPNKKSPLFPHLVNIDLFTSCHQATIEDVISFLENSPALNCLQMTHEDPCICFNTDKKKVNWQSKLPRNSEGNYQHACFRNIDCGDEKSRVINLLLRRLTAKKRKVMETSSTD